MARGQEAGQVVPLTAIAVLVGAVMAMVVAVTGSVLADHARARTAADAAALAGAVGGDDRARQLAAENGATLVSVRRDGPDVEVKVRVGRASAVARARPTRTVLGS